MFYYYFICKRKLWYFRNEIQMESNSEAVEIGKLIDEKSYKRDRKHIMINETINIDFMRNRKVIHEIKKSDSMEEASIWQVKYYIYYLKKHGVEDIKAILDYPKLKKRVDVELNKDDEEEIEKILLEIEKIVRDQKMPSIIDSKICKKCSYYELCYI
ncbi:CRISPR-associated protein Cas4 [Hypnocyclicus thermotrophus]|nr:CRISPR-associated protein Cas4 [Hypnocyclicus thermotrophus]